MSILELMVCALKSFLVVIAGDLLPIPRRERTDAAKSILQCTVQFPTTKNFTAPKYPTAKVDQS